MQKWEYCAIYGLNSNGDPGVKSKLVFFSESGEKEERVPEVAKTIARLGVAGWELIGAANTSETWHCLYFKRLQQGS